MGVVLDWATILLEQESQKLMKGDTFLHVFSIIFSKPHNIH